MLTLAAIFAVALGVGVLAAWWGASESRAAEKGHDDALALWESKEPKAYSFDYSYCSGMCASCRFHVTVTNGEITDAGRQCKAIPSPDVPTIEDVFAMEKRARSVERADLIKIDYDATNFRVGP